MPLGARGFAQNAGHIAPLDEKDMPSRFIQELLEQEETTGFDGEVRGIRPSFRDVAGRPPVGIEYIEPFIQVHEGVPVACGDFR